MGGGNEEIYAGMIARLQVLIVQDGTVGTSVLSLQLEDGVVYLGAWIVSGAPKLILG